MANTLTANPPTTLHPILHEISLRSLDEALRILNYLLATNAVSAEQVRQAHAQPPPAAPTPLESSIPAIAKVKKQKLMKQNPPPDPSTYRTRHIALLLYYDGRNYSGLAENRGVATDTSVERALFAALSRAKLLMESEACPRYSRSGRTDKGVSAVGQVVALPLRSAFAPHCCSVESPPPSGIPLQETDLPKRSGESIRVWVPPKKKKKTTQEWVCKEVAELEYDKILNNLLPPDIRVLGWAPVSNEFSARFSTVSRTYRYYFIRKWFNEDRMREGLQLMVGEHDFSNFCKMNIEEVSNFVRTIHNADVKVLDDTVGYFLIHGQAFLWHQIRCIAAILFLIGRGLEEPSLVSKLLDVQCYPGKPSYPLADQHHLVLHECSYRNLKFGFSATNLWGLTMHFRKQWEFHMLMAARLQSAMNRLLDDATVFPSDLYSFAVSKLQRRAKKQKGKSATIHSPQATDAMKWHEALQWLQESCQLQPDPDLTSDFAYTPVLQRSKGPAYQEKVASLLANSSSKRLHRFQENQAKKAKTKEEDDTFYQTKLAQGSSL